MDSDALMNLLSFESSVSISGLCSPSKEDPKGIHIHIMTSNQTDSLFSNEVANSYSGTDQVNSIVSA